MARRRPSARARSIAVMVVLARAASARAQSVERRESHAIEGRFDFTPLTAIGLNPNEITVTVSTESHGKRFARVRADGTFALRDVPAGRHRLDVDALGLNYPPLAVTVRGENDDEGEPGSVVATYAEDVEVVVETMPLKMVPASVAEYFEPATTLRPADVVKHPLFLVMCAMVLAVLMPKLLEMIDPEELEALRRDMARAGAKMERTTNAPRPERVAATSTSNANKMD